MTDRVSRLRPSSGTVLIALGCALIGGVAGWTWQAHRLQVDPAQRIAAGDRAAIEQVVHDYLLAHPEILPRAMDALEQRQTADRLGAVRTQVEQPAPGAVLGNPQGKITLVEFTDYACGYCRASVSDVEALIAANPDLRVVVREFPILTPESADAAKMALAAAEQGRYAAFHRAMFVTGRPSAETIADAARAAGLDLARAQRVIAAPATAAELDRNHEFGRQLGLNGTPSWVIGNSLLSGAVGREELAKAIAAARG